MERSVDAQEFYQRLEEVLEVEPGTLNGEEALADVENWDSVAVLSFIAMVDQHYGVRVPPKEIAQCKTVSGLAELVARFKA